MKRFSQAKGMSAWAALSIALASSAAAQQPASPATAALQALAGTLTPAEEAAEAAEDADARRGLIAQIPDGLIQDSEGRTIIDWRPYAFLNAEAAPATVHPRLWRQARRNAIHGLFEVVPGAIWQVRGYDISVMTIIRGATGWIIVDPLTSEEAARASLALVNRTLGERPVVAVLYSHSHADHYAGVAGVTSADAVRAGQVRVIAPHGFVREAVSENVLAGPAMTARANYMFGTQLAAGPTGQVDTGLGPRLAAGTMGFIAPTETVGAEGGLLDIDGVRFEFMDAAGTEAPAEFLFFLPQWNALHTTEVATKTLHNLLTLRGAQVRDALRWSQVIDNARALWGADTLVQLGSHGWPTFGADRTRAYLEAQRDAYRFIHDRALGAANRGDTIQELPAEVIADSAALHPSVRGYYGTLNHNAKAVYQRYFGWWDGVPAHFNPLPPSEAATRYVRLAGGSAAMLAAGERAMAEGDYRWAAELLNHLMFAEPDNGDARRVLADAYEQLGYQAESGAWRNYYLAAVATLRGSDDAAAGGRRQSPAFSAALQTIDLLNALATAYVPDPAMRAVQHFQFRFPDTDEGLSVEVRPLVEIPREGAAHGAATATMIIPRTAFLALISGRMTYPQLVAAGQVEVRGDAAAMLGWLARHRRPGPAMAVVTP